MSTGLSRVPRSCAFAAASLLLLSACAEGEQTVSSSPVASESAPAASSSAPAEQASKEATEEPVDEPVEEVTEEVAEEPSEEPAAALTPPVNDGYKVDPAAIVTTELTTGELLATDPYVYAAADQPALVFQTPDPQVACLMQPYGAFCMTDDSVNWVLLSVSMKPGDTVPRSLQAQGRAATHDWFQTGTPLPEGQSLEWMGMTCTSTGATSVQCHDGSTGFNLSDEQGR